MTPRRADRDLSSVNISTYGEAGDEVEIAGGIFLAYREFITQIEDAALPFDLQMRIEIRNGRPECRGLELRSREDGPAVTGSWLRGVPLASYMERSMDVQWPTYRRPDPDPDAYVEAVSSEELKRERRTRQPRSQLLPKVVAEYRRALADPDPEVRRAPTQAVADRLHYQRGHVSRLLSQARRDGILGEAQRGRAGEAVPVKQTRGKR